jgi:hypothetical protein
MFCRFCGATLPDDSTFCQSCGKTLATAAPVSSSFGASAGPDLAGRGGGEAKANVHLSPHASDTAPR